MKTFKINDAEITVDYDFEFGATISIIVDKSLVKNCVFQCPMELMNLYQKLDEKRMAYFLKQMMLYNIGVRYDLISWILFFEGWSLFL